MCRHYNVTWQVKLPFGDDLPKAIKDISETNKIGQALKKQNFVPMNHTPSDRIQPQNFSPRGTPFLQRGWGKKGRIRQSQSYRNYLYQNNKGSQRH